MARFLLDYLQISMPLKPLTKILHKFRMYKLLSHCEFLAHINMIGKKAGVQNCAIKDIKTLVLFLNTRLCLELPLAPPAVASTMINTPRKTLMRTSSKGSLIEYFYPPSPSVSNCIPRYLLTILHIHT